MHASAAVARRYNRREIKRQCCCSPKGTGAREKESSGPGALISPMRSTGYRVQRTTYYYARSSCSSDFLDQTRASPSCTAAATGSFNPLTSEGRVSETHVTRTPKELDREGGREKEALTPRAPSIRVLIEFIWGFFLSFHLCFRRGSLRTCTLGYRDKSSTTSPSHSAVRAQIESLARRRRRAFGVAPDDNEPRGRRAFI